MPTRTALTLLMTSLHNRLLDFSTSLLNEGSEIFQTAKIKKMSSAGGVIN
jgi:hypothetical protein